MDLEEPTPQGGAGTQELATDGPPAAKIRAIGNTDVEKLKANLELLCKLTLSNTQAVRALKTIVMQTFKIPNESPFYVAYKKGTKKFNDLIEAASSPQQKAKVAPPMVYCWNEIVKYVIGLGGNIAKAISESAEGWTQEAVMDQIRHMQISKMYGGTHSRLEVACPGSIVLERAATMIDPDATNLSPEAVWIVIKDCLIKTEGTVVLRGRAPPGEMERQVQQLLDAVKAKS